MAKTEFWNSDSWLRNTSKTKFAPYLYLHYNKPKSEHQFFRLLDMTNPHLLYISGFVMTSRWILDRRRIRFLGSNSWKSQNFEKMQMTIFWKRLIKPDHMAKTEFWNSDSWLRNTSKTKIAPYLYLHYNKPKSEHQFLRLLDMTNHHICGMVGILITKGTALDRRRSTFRPRGRNRGRFRFSAVFGLNFAPKHV